MFGEAKEVNEFSTLLYAVLASHPDDRLSQRRKRVAGHEAHETARATLGTHANSRLHNNHHISSGSDNPGKQGNLLDLESHTKRCEHGWASLGRGHRGNTYQRAMSGQNLRSGPRPLMTCRSKDLRDNSVAHSERRRAPPRADQPRLTLGIRRTTRRSTGCTLQSSSPGGG